MKHKIQSSIAEAAEGHFSTGTPGQNEKFLQDVRSHGYFPVKVAQAIVSINTTTRNIEITAHTARKGDLLKILDGNAIGLEVSVFNIVDANNLIIAENFETVTAPVAADTVDILRSSSFRLDSAGSLSVSSLVTFTRDAANQTVTEDTATPANNRPLPVKIIGLNGNLEVTAQNLNIQSTHTGANPDSMRIGDGTETVNVNASNELQVADDTARISLATLAGAVSGTEMQVDIVAPLPAGTNNIGDVDVLSSALPTGAATSALQVSSEAILTAIDADTSALAGTVAGSEQQVDVVAPLPTGSNNIGDIDIASIIATIDSNNSTTATLGSGATFTGVATNIKDFASIVVFLFADEASATNGLSLEFSIDGTNWDEKLTHTIPANQAETFIHTANAQFFRVVYTNGATGQTAFRLETILRPVASTPIEFRVGQSVSDNLLAMVTRAILSARKPDMTYVNIEATAGGNLKVAVEEFDAGASIPAGTNKIGIVDTESKTPVAKTIKAAQVTVGTSEVRLTTDGSAPDADRVLLRFRPDTANVGRLFYGPTGLTTSTGIEIFTGESDQMLFDAGDYFVISDTAAQTLHVIEQE